MAQELVNTLGDQHSARFYALVARKIPEAAIRQALARNQSRRRQQPAETLRFQDETVCAAPQTVAWQCAPNMKNETQILIKNASLFCSMPVCSGQIIILPVDSGVCH